MQVVIEGVKIELTPEQVQQIEKVRAEREKCRNSYQKMLKHFGFEKCDTSTWLNKKANAWVQEHYDWYAEIQHSGGIHSLWLVGPGLKTTNFNDGWIYWSPADAEKEIVKAIDKLSASE